jgi:hypothetical protein
MPRIVLDVCPQCQADVSRRMGFITKPTIVCPRCQYEMLVTSRAVVNNWGYNIAALAILVAWGFFLMIAFNSPQVKPPTGGAAGQWAAFLVGIGLGCFIPALIVAGIPAVIVGRCVGHWMAARLGAR